MHPSIVSFQQQKTIANREGGGETLFQTPLALVDFGSHIIPSQMDFLDAPLQ